MKTIALLFVRSREINTWAGTKIARKGKVSIHQTKYIPIYESCKEYKIFIVFSVEIREDNFNLVTLNIPEHLELEKLVFFFMQ